MKPPLCIEFHPPLNSSNLFTFLRYLEHVMFSPKLASILLVAFVLTWHAFMLSYSGLAYLASVSSSYLFPTSPLLNGLLLQASCHYTSYVCKKWFLLENSSAWSIRNMTSSTLNVVFVVLFVSSAILCFSSTFFLLLPHFFSVSP